MKAFANDYATLIAGIRARAGSPRIVILNVPNAAGLPFLAGASLAQRQAAQRAAVGMTRTAVNALASPSITVVDLMCDGRSYIGSNYSSDGLHPNDAGYAFISARSRQGDHRQLVSRAAKQLRADDDRAVTRAVRRSSDPSQP